MRHRRWTLDETEYLKTVFAQKTRAEIAADLGRTTRSIKDRIFFLGMNQPQCKLYEWSNEDDDLLLANYKKMSYSRLANLLGRSEHGIRNRIKIIANPDKKNHCQAWTEDDDKLLSRLYTEHKSIKEITQIMERTETAVTVGKNSESQMLLMWI